MDALTERDRQQLAIVEDALRTYPLVDAPSDFSKAVMGHVHSLAPKPRFRLSWLDYFLSLFLPGMAVTMLFVWWSLPSQVTVFWADRLVLLWEYLELAHLDLMLLLGGLMIMVLFFVLAFMLVRPRYWKVF